MSLSREPAPSQPMQADSKTGRVWEIAELLSERLGRRAARKAVIEAYVSEGGNRNTAATQFAYWKQAYEAQHDRREVKPGTVTPTRLVIGKDGRFVVPAEMRAAMLVDGETAVTAEVVDGELRIMSPRTAVRKVQQRLAHLKNGENSGVDEFLAEKRAEVERDDEATRAWLRSGTSHSGSSE